MTDLELWRQLKAGDRAALETIYRRHAALLLQYGRKFALSQPLVEDCIQDLFLKLWQKRKTLSKVTTVQTYLMVALRNCIYDFFRKKKSVYPLEGPEETEKSFSEPSIEDRWVKSERQAIQRKVAKEALNDLPERMRQAVYLRYFEGREYTEIAQIMNIRTQVAINMVYRAGKKLRAYSNRYSEWIFCCFISSFLL